MRVYVSYHTAFPDPIVERMIEQLRWRYGAMNVIRPLYVGLAPYQYALMVQQGIEQSDALLILIDRTWLTVRESYALPAILDPQSPLSVELAAFLQSKKLVIPVLLNQSRMPSTADLPPHFAHFTLRQAVMVRSDPMFHADMDTLYVQIQKQVSWRPASPLLLGGGIVLFGAFIAQLCVIFFGGLSPIFVSVDLVSSTIVVLVTFATFLSVLWLALTRKQYIWLSGISLIFLTGIGLLVFWQSSYALFVVNLTLIPTYIVLVLCFSLFGKRRERV